MEGCAAVEMECAALVICGQFHGVKFDCGMCRKKKVD